jgi:hypothetical protein
VQEAAPVARQASYPATCRASGRPLMQRPSVHRCEWGRGDGPAAGQQLPVIVEQHDTVAEQAPTLLEMGSHDPCGAVIRRQSVRAAGLMLAHVDLQLENDLPCCLPFTITHRRGFVVTAGGQLRYLLAGMRVLQSAPSEAASSSTSSATRR